jgi:hypothetical protein
MPSSVKFTKREEKTTGLASLLWSLFSFINQLAMITGALRWGPLNKSEASDDILNTRLPWP